jgi:hypothetical protein
MRMIVLLEDFDISKPSALFFWNRERRIEEILQRADGFQNPDGRFYRKFEHFSFGGNHHSKLDESIAQFKSIGTYPKLKFWRSVWLGPKKS